jgi:hypothetical protein
MKMREIGRIVRLQIQTGSLKKGDRLNRYYDPAALLSVPAIRVMVGGVMGLVDGRELIDVHHKDHPESKNRADNDVSINFTPHYEQMQARFGERLVTGIAGENILVETAESFSVEDLRGGVWIETGDGRVAWLHQVIVDNPCEPFSEYVLGMPGTAAVAVKKETLQFLGAGMRGYYCVLDGEPVVVRVGDRVGIGD